MSGFAAIFPGVTAAVLLAGGGFAAAADTPVMPPVGTVAQVRALSRAEAKLQPPVTLRGVVTYCRHLTTSDATVQDATGGIWLPEMPVPAGFKPGVEVEITGRAEAGVFGPFVRAQTVRVLGGGTMPAALPVNYEELLATRLNSQRVELTGVIRSQRVNPEAGLSWLAIELASNGGRVTVNVTHEITAHPELVGARVRVSGVCLHSPNPGTQQVLLPSLNVHELKDITILSPGVTRPFDLPVVPMNQLLSQSSQSEADRLVHVRGIVTLVPPHGPLAVQDDTRGLRVWLRDEGLRPFRGGKLFADGFYESEISSSIPTASPKIRSPATRNALSVAGCEASSPFMQVWWASSKSDGLLSNARRPLPTCRARVRHSSGKQASRACCQDAAHGR
jgi:hypothetical protein